MLTNILSQMYSMAKLLQGLFLSIRKNIGKDSLVSFLIFEKSLYADGNAISI